MRWPWHRAVHTSSCPQPRLLPTATAGISFEAAYTIIWRPRRRTHPQAEEAVRSQVHSAAVKAASHLDAADLPAAQDAVNTALIGLPQSGRHYRLLASRATLRLSAAAQELIAQQQADEQRIRRLRFLKTNLYDHPDLVVLDRLEHHSPGALDDGYVAELQRLARLIRSCDRWWSPLLQQWEQLGQGFNDTEMQQQAMLALFDSLKALNGGSPPAQTAPLGSSLTPPRKAHP
ncbi:hypothetical protein ACFU76_23065 [Streptomyces sp. NPDC057539]|uniref:hypothetical protein n=1 Tax=Streptomyces sp. NPDC057539 TaxID=3346159 RepID=UPI003692D476